MNKIVIMFLLFCACFADTLILNNDKKIQGRIVHQNKRLVTIRCEDGYNHSYPINKVLIILKESDTHSYLRYSKVSKTRSVLESAIKTFRNDKGKEVTLVSTLHVGDKGYYRKLETFLDRYQVVLYEGIGASPVPNLQYWVVPTQKERNIDFSGLFDTEKKRAMSFANSTNKQIALGKQFNLAVQIFEINTFKTYWVCVDVTVEELKKYMKNHKVSFFERGEMGEMIELSVSILSVALPNLFRDGTLKEGFAVFLATRDRDSITPLMRALVLDRNTYIFKHVKKALENINIKGIAMYYGTAHMLDFEKKLKNEGFYKVEERWIVAWEMGVKE